MKHITVITMTCALCLGRLVAHGNQLQNGDFELPLVGPGGFNSGYQAFAPPSTFSGCTVAGSSAANVAITPATEFTSGGVVFAAAEGNQWLDLTGDTDNGAATGIEQSFPTVPGAEYLLSFYVGNLNNPGYFANGPARVIVNLNGNLFQTVVNNGPSGLTPNWVLFGYTFTASSPTTTLAFINDTPAGVAMNGIDGVSVNPVPEPGSMTLLGLAVLVAVSLKWNLAFPGVRLR